MDAHKIALSNSSFSEFYREYKNIIQVYIIYRIPRKYEAEDLVQDVFLRLLDCGTMINRKTISSFLFTIAHNIVMDVLRRHYKKEEIMADLEYSMPTSSNMVEQEIDAEEIAMVYQEQVRLLPSQRRKVYEMIDLDDMSISEVAGMMNLSQRTVQNHLYIARNEIKDKLTSILEAV